MTKRSKQSGPLPKTAAINEAALTALENERRYVAKELHDGIAQTTLQLGLQVGICRKMLERGMLEMLAQELVTLEIRTHQASGQVRELIADMRPPRLDDDAGLVEYLQSAVDTHQERGGVLVEFHSHLSQSMPDFLPRQKLAMQRIVQEALLNVRKHAKAKHISLTLTDDKHNFYLTINDDGVGFEAAEAEAQPADRQGAGLSNLRARATALGGTLSIRSSCNGGGTEIKLILPTG